MIVYYLLDNFGDHQNIVKSSICQYLSYAIVKCNIDNQVTKK